MGFLEEMYKVFFTKTLKKLPPATIKRIVHYPFFTEVDMHVNFVQVFFVGSDIYRFALFPFHP